MKNKRILINASGDGDIRVATTENQKLINLDIDRPNLKQTKANVYKGKISSIEPSLGAVFVNYGAERHGFLPLKEISHEYFLKEIDPNTPVEKLNLNEILKIGQEVVVQVEKEERGTKGAAITTFISLAGSYLVLMPNNPRAGGVSRRIDAEHRDKLRELLNQLTIPEGMGVIIRTAGVGRSKEELQWDLDILLQYWEAIKRAAIDKPGPYLIHEESDAIMRALRDHLRQDISEVWVDQLEAFERIKHYIAIVRPDFINHIKYYENSIPLFSHYQIEKQIEKIYHREVHLPSGGSIVIDHTEALVSIDINSAHATRGRGIEDTALNTNLEACDEVARQLRLRDIGGLIIIDFIDMTPVRHQREVENRLREALQTDRARIQVGRISKFGLLEMSRQRLRSSLNKALQIICPRCHGQGSIRNAQSLALSIVRTLQEQSAKTNEAHFIAQVPMEVATFLTNEQRRLIVKIEEANKAKISIIPNAQLQTPNYYIKQARFRNSSKSDESPSYNLIERGKPLSFSQQEKAGSEKNSAEPVIRKFLDQDPVTTVPKPSFKGKNVIIKFLDFLFGAKKEQKKSRTNNKRSHPPHGRSSSSSQHRKYHHQRRRRPPSSSSKRSSGNRYHSTSGSSNNRRRTTNK